MINVIMVCVLSAMYIHLKEMFFCPIGTSYLSTNNQTWKILGKIFYVYLKEYTAKIRVFKNLSVGRKFISTLYVK